mmetsp:Transcript_69973/g.221714  ORF Transcript_69973/g.221714 Transcript_69973/m.221714 type:complete len:456 (-) Transcript_69973:116-1483(-)|eukprot:CAMPEP_0182909282 /NCGR_PEP_ID=MMETSP0034_2-20130328/35667_1 /TAXON_ID=156128 /ORGANISM="Nephroselmis pyriformis, Strain CCMP717" /LENGTH=455 /DNA_ID=CAMNT_0025045527 /DNA_START=127 /DNA_END=1494 /DNA_ORIENTATION=+
MVDQEPTHSAGDAPAVGHGKGNTGAYYKKWDEFAAEEVAKVSEEEEEARQAEEERKAHAGPVSEAQKRDLEKRAALREAKKQWDDVQRGEEAMKALIEGEKSLGARVVAEGDLGGRQVLVLKGNEECVYEVPEDCALIKLFIEDCKRCRVNLHCSLKTSFVEIAHCEGVTLEVSTHPAHTVQVDMSSHVTVIYRQGAMVPGVSKCYHNSVTGLKVEYDASGTGKDTKVQELDDFALAAMNPHIAEKDQQFVTALLEESGELVTDLVLRDARGHPTTQREVDDRRAKLEAAAAARGVDVSDPIVQQTLAEFEPVSVLQRGEVLKAEGNAAFKEKDYRQASVHYSQALQAFDSVVGDKGDEMRNLMCTCFANRSFCSAKLGEHANSLADADEALKINPKHPKALFRKGLALHALGQWGEACLALSAALEIKPGDKDIKTALAFAERKAAMAARPGGQ